MRRFVSSLLLQIILATKEFAQVPDEDWDLEDPYNEVLVNCAYDLEWDLDWERRLLSDNGVRVNVGSVTSEEFLTRADIRLNQPLDEKWWFQGRFHRSQSRPRSINPDQLFLGLERSIFESSSLYERLWPRNGLSLAYAFGLPNADYESLTGGNPYQLDEYGDKLILGWRHRFSREAQLLISISHEVSAQGFGGGNVQFQMFL